MKKKSKLNNLKAELILKFAEIDDLCKHYGYAVIPTLLLRHRLGADSSILISNDSPSEIIGAVGGICTVGESKDISPHDACLYLAAKGT